MIGFSFERQSISTRPFGRLVEAFERERTLLIASIPVAVAVGVAASLLPTLLAVAVVVLAGLGTIFLSKPRLAVMALLGIRASTDVLQDQSLFSLGGQIEINAAAALGFGIVLLGTYYIIANRINPFDNPISVGYSAFLAIGLVGLLLSNSPMTVIADWMRAASLLIIFTLINHLVRTKATLHQVLWTIGLSSIVPVLLGTYQFATGNGVFVDGFNRVYGTFVVPPIYAFYLVLLLPLAIVAFANARSNWRRVAFAGWLLLIVVNLFATYTRGAWIGAGLSLAVIAVLRFRMLLVVLPLAALVMVAAVPQVTERFSDLGKEKADVSYKEANTLAWRIKYWRDSVLGLENSNLLVGTGLGTIRKVLYVDAHNDYLRLFVETGVLGLSCYLFVLLALARATWASLHRVTEPFFRDIVVAFSATFVAFVVMSFADNIVLNSVLQWYFWSLAAVVLVIGRDASRRGGAPRTVP